MLYDDADKPEYFLWRFMIAEPYHDMGFVRNGEMYDDEIGLERGL